MRGNKSKFLTQRALPLSHIGSADFTQWAFLLALAHYIFV